MPRHTITRLLAGALLILFAATPASAEGLDVSWVFGKERPGADIATIDTAAGAEACWTYCRDNDQCRAWTLIEERRGKNVSRQTCHLKADVLAEIDNPAAISGLKRTVAPSGSSFERGVCRDRGQYSQTAVDKAEACQAKCDTDAACKAWAFVTVQAQNCFLFAHVPPPRADRYCTSGAKP